MRIRFVLGDSIKDRRPLPALSELTKLLPTGCRRRIFTMNIHCMVERLNQRPEPLPALAEQSRLMPTGRRRELSQ
jgi:hypothetical protein